MSILKKLFGAGSKSSDLQRDFERHVPAALAALLEIQIETGLTWTTILPAAKRVAGLVFLKSFGPVGADQFYGSWLKGDKTKGDVPATSIREMKVPTATAEEKELAGMRILNFMNSTVAQGNSSLPLAMALDNSADIIARQKVASWYAVWLTDQIRQELKAGSFDL